MFNKRTEFWIGLFVLLSFSAILFVALKASNLNLQASKGYSVYAYFNEIGGLRKGAPITLSGVRIGQIGTIGIDKKTYQARVELIISEHYKNLPLDSSASILTSGILGEKYIGITPGAELDFLQNDSVIDITQSAVVLENLISKFLNK